jgi:hypothetical protein
LRSNKIGERLSPLPLDVTFCGHERSPAPHADAWFYDSSDAAQTAGAHQSPHMREQRRSVGGATGFGMS